MNIVTVIFTAIVLSLIAYFIYRIATDKKNKDTDTRAVKDTVLMTVKTQEYLIYNKKNLSFRFTKDIQNATKFNINDDLLLKFKTIRKKDLSESTFSLKKIKDDRNYILSNGVYALNFEVDPSFYPEYFNVGSAQRTTIPFPDSYFLKAVRV
jgi:flagellar biosynthesis component FlhA